MIVLCQSNFFYFPLHRLSLCGHSLMSQSQSQSQSHPSRRNALTSCYRPPPPVSACPQPDIPLLVDILERWTLRRPLPPIPTSTTSHIRSRPLPALLSSTPLVDNAMSFPVVTVWKHVVATGTGARVF